MERPRRFGIPRASSSMFSSRPCGRIDSALGGCVFRGQTESVPAHRVQDVEPLAPAYNARRHRPSRSCGHDRRGCSPKDRETSPANNISACPRRRPPGRRRPPPTLRAILASTVLGSYLAMTRTPLAVAMRGDERPRRSGSAAKVGQTELARLGEDGVLDVGGGLVGGRRGHPPTGVPLLTSLKTADVEAIGAQTRESRMYTVALNRSFGFSGLIYQSVITTPPYGSADCQGHERQGCRAWRAKDSC